MSQHQAFRSSSHQFAHTFSRRCHALLITGDRGKVLLYLLCLALLALGCETKDASVIDPSSVPPLLDQVTYSPTSINTDTINVGTSRQPNDLLHLAVTIHARITLGSNQRISEVRCEVSNPAADSIVAQGLLADDGHPPDTSPNDGIYSAIIGLQIRRVDIGNYPITILAEAQNGFRSISMILPLTIFRGNHAPVLSNLQAPDTIRISSQIASVTLRIDASDPDGLADVQRVVFNSFKPDGTPAGGNPFQMYDDGSPNHGDLIAGDGVYSLVTLPPTQAGNYRFEFQAFDRSNVGSNVIVHTIVVTQ